MAWKLGSELQPCDQLRALCRWSRTPQFADDADWLDNTRFRVNGKGRLDGRARTCYPQPTMTLLLGNGLSRSDTQMLMPARSAAE